MSKPSSSSASEIKVVATNRKARQRFFVLESFEAGISLYGHEVKSLRFGKVSIEESFAQISNHEIFLLNTHIPPYSHLSHIEYEPTRTRKLLMHKREINRISTETQAKGLTLVPLEIYFKNGVAKVAIGLAKGKKTVDRREEIKKREVERAIRRNLSQTR